MELADRDRLSVPEVALSPLQAPEALQEVASVELQERVMVPGALRLAELVFREIVGSGRALVVMVRLWLLGLLLPALSSASSW